MSLNTVNIENLSASEKAKLFSTLQNDQELQDYMISKKMLFEELDRRDKAYAEGKIQLTSRKELSLFLRKRRDAL